MLQLPLSIKKRKDEPNLYLEEKLHEQLTPGGNLVL